MDDVDRRGESQALSLLGNKYFWIIVGLIFLTGLVYYAPDFPALDWLSLDQLLGITRRAFARALFLIPIFIAAWKFRFIGGLICTIISGLIMIPRIIVSPSMPDAVAEATVICCIGIIVSYLFNELDKARIRQKTISDDLAKVNVRLREMDRLKSVFLASMSHELRTPLNSIIGFTGIMLMGMAGDLNDEQKRQLNMVKNSANHLLSLINDVLDISKIEAGKVELWPEKFLLIDVVQEVIENVSTMAISKGLRIIMELPEDIILYNDKRRIKQVLMNLLSNAIKFTDHGSVKISGHLLTDNNLEICVIDTGKGIKEEDKIKLFQPFQRIDMSISKSYVEGTGLGLYLTQSLINLLGGSIHVVSEYGKGSEFVFTVPLRYMGEELK